jgi:hypothetical protein
MLSCVSIEYRTPSTQLLSAINEAGKLLMNLTQGTK